MIRQKLIIVVTLACMGFVVENTDYSVLSRGRAQDGLCSAPPIAQTSANGVEDLLKDLVNVLGPLGFLGWYCYYVTSRVLPAKDAALATERAAYQEEMERERVAHSLKVDALVGEIKEQREAILEIVRSCQANRKTP